MESPGYKYSLAIACMFKNATLFLREFIEYHLLVGVEHFYLANHGSQDAYEPILQPYIERGLVDLIHIDKSFHNGLDFETNVHRDFYLKMINNARDCVKWLACIDIDEFIVPINHEKIIDVLNKETDPTIGGISINWICYGTSQVEKVPADKLLLETLVMRSEVGFKENLHIKTICRPDRVCNMTNPHYFEYYHPYYSKIAGGDKTQGPFSKKVNIKELRVNHYRFGDMDYCKKVKFPFLSTYHLVNPHRKDEIFRYLGGGLYDVIEDRIMDRFVPILKEKIKTSQ